MSISVWGIIPLLPIIIVLILVAVVIATAYVVGVSVSVAYTLSAGFELPHSFRLVNAVTAAFGAPMTFLLLLATGALAELYHSFAAVLGFEVGVLAILTLTPTCVGLASSLFYTAVYRMQHLQIGRSFCLTSPN